MSFLLKTSMRWCRQTIGVSEQVVALPNYFAVLVKENLFESQNGSDIAKKDNFLNEIDSHGRHLRGCVWKNSQDWGPCSKVRLNLIADYNFNKDGGQINLFKTLNFRHSPLTFGSMYFDENVLFLQHWPTVRFRSPPAYLLSANQVLV